MASPSPQGYSPPIFWAFLRRTNLGTGPLGAYFWARQCPRPIFGTRRPLAKSGPLPSPADELGQPLPPRLQPTRFLGIFAADENWGRDRRVLIFGRGSARGEFLAHGGPSQSLAPFLVRRTNLASPSPQGNSRPIFWAFLRRTNLGTGPSGTYFWARQCPWPILGTRRPLAKSGPIPSPADELGQPLPPRL